jgi:hypothetical protein
MKINWVVTVILIIGIIGWGCSTGSDQKQAHISGKFSGINSIAGEFSGIELTIIKRDSANADPDTLFNAHTDTSGAFSGIATFPEKRQYSMLISRDDQELGQMGIILADGDSVRIEGDLPTLEESISISSREHDAMTRYQRLNRNFRRITQAAHSGQLTGDSLRQQLRNWTDIYWEVYENSKGTIASQLSARQSINILQGLDNEEMMKRIRVVQENDELVDLGATIGKNYIANDHGLEPALAYLDTLSRITEAQDKAIQIDMQRIKLLYDSAHVDAAKEQLDLFKEKYPDDESSKEWVESISYDLNYLSPGDSIPDFQFSQNGKIISRDSLIGSPFILEITRLSNQLYQNQFDRTVIIHGIYKSYGLEVVTIPLDESQVTVDSFFDERVKPWPVADVQAFDRQKLLKEFNIKLIPTRFLIDREGKIVRKYIGNEYEDVIQGVQRIIEKDKDKETPS